MESKKQEIMDNLIKDIRKRYGEGAIQKLDETKKLNIDCISTGSLAVDIATGVGGFPRGRIIEIYGPESSGKTTLALSTIAQCQKGNGTAAFIDAEHAFDPTYAANLGITLKDLYVSQPDSGEQALNITEDLIRSGVVDLIVIDSVAALVPRTEIEGAMGDTQIGLQARLMSQALRKITFVANKSKSCVIFINQLRMKIGGYGNPETTTGGMALKFYSSIRVEVRKGEVLKDKEEAYGHISKVKIVKNKVAPPFRNTEITILFNRGIYNLATLVEEAVKIDLIQKSGAWYSYNTERIGQGKETVFKFLEESPEILKQIEQTVRENYHLGSSSSNPNPSEPAEGKEPKKKAVRKKKEEGEEYL